MVHRLTADGLQCGTLADVQGRNTGQANGPGTGEVQVLSQDRGLGEGWPGAGGVGIKIFIPINRGCSIDGIGKI